MKSGMPASCCRACTMSMNARITLGLSLNVRRRRFSNGVRRAADLRRTIGCAMQWIFSRKPKPSARLETTMRSCAGTPAHAPSCATNSRRGRRITSNPSWSDHSPSPPDPSPTPGRGGEVTPFPYAGEEEKLLPFPTGISLPRIFVLDSAGRRRGCGSHNPIHGGDIDELLEPFPQYSHAGLAIALAALKAAQLRDPAHRLPQRRRHIRRDRDPLDTAVQALPFVVV